MNDSDTPNHPNAAAAEAKPFDSEEWFERLHALNPWVGANNLTLPGPEDFDELGHSAGPDFRAALREECMRRFQAGKADWNKWAEGMLALKAELEAAGLWKTDRRDRPVGDKFVSLLQGDRAESAAFVALSQGDFQAVEFAEDARFQEFAFPGDARFEGAAFSGDARFDKATFSGDAWFDEAAFSGDARFDEAAFSGDAWFDEAAFSGPAWFHEAAFSGDAWFGEAAFSRIASFDEAAFSGPAWFGEAAFSGPASFHEAAFSGDAWFGHAKFNSATNFADATFKGSAVFRATQGKEGSSFSLADATFDQVPNFIQAHFQKAPRLDNVKVGVGKLERDADMAARWRALRGLAIDAHDYEREMDFFAGEVIARRGVEDFPQPLRKGKSNTGRYWLGRLFEWFSDFGRSAVRPVVWWIALVIFFTLVNLLFHHTHGAASDASKQPPFQECVNEKTDPETSAFYLAIGKGLVVGTYLDRYKTAASYKCLYGSTASGQPYVPTGVALLSMLQMMLSITLITLFLLAVRNQFRIR